MAKFQYKKSVQALNLLAIWSGGELNKMKALKLIWLADRLHLRKYGRPIIQDFYVAMENGPVPSATRDILQKNNLGVSASILEYSDQFISPRGQYDYKSVNSENARVFSESDLQSLNQVFETYGHLDKWQLRDLTHQFPEWKRWEVGINDGSYNSHPMDYNDFFSNVGKDQSLFDEDEAILQMVHDLYLRKE